MRFTRPAIIATLIFAALIAIGLLAVVQVGAKSPSSTIAPQPPRDISKVKNLDNVSSGGFGIPRTQSGIPAFTSNDVNNYINTHPFPLGPTTTGKPPIIISIAFITSKVASQQMAGEDIGLPDTAIVCYVKLEGPFTLSDVPHPPSAIIGPSQTATEVFDAQTGNLLVVRSE